MLFPQTARSLSAATIRITLGAGEKAHGPGEKHFERVTAVRSPAGSCRANLPGVNHQRICQAAGCIDSRAQSRDRRLGADARKILREAETKRPVQRDADLLVESWQLAQINGAPKPPREEAREVDSEDVGDSGSSADRGQLT
jgi:hypothetical protein